MLGEAGLDEHLLAFLKHELEEGERVLDSIRGWVGEEPAPKRGTLIVSDKRVCFYRRSNRRCRRSVLLPDVERITSYHRQTLGLVTIRDSEGTLHFRTFEAEEVVDRFTDRLIELVDI